MPNFKLVLSIIDYLKNEARNETNSDTQESLEVAIQCLETAYDIDSNVAKNTLAVSLEDIFNSAFPDTGECEESGEPMNKAEIMKNLGNSLMKSNKFSEAIRYYTAAIEINNRNAIYYCNRAAAYSKLNDFENAIKDCQKAIDIDPMYAKAYGRMGLAYSSVGRHTDAIKAFEKAVHFDPTNESYSANLKLALEKQRPSNQAGAGGINLGNLNSIDWSSLINNPEFRNMASTIMQDPNIINALSGLSANMTTPLNTGAGDASNSGQNTSGTVPAPRSAAASSNLSLDMLLEAGQLVASTIQAANPDLVDQFRQSSRNSQNQNNRDPPPPQ